MTRRRWLCRIWRSALCLAVAVGLLLPWGVGIPAAAGAGTGGWSAIGSMSSAIRAVAVSPFSGAVLACVEGQGVYYAAEGAQLRKCSSQLDNVFATTAAWVSASTAIVGTNGSGAFRSEDAGRTWEHIDTLDCSNIARIVRDTRISGGVFAASYCTGLHYSTDAGRTWTRLQEGMNTRLTTDVARVGNGAVLVATMDKGVFRAPSVGGAFVPVGTLTIAKHVVASPEGHTAYAASDRDLTISTDEGVTWKSVAVPGGSFITGLEVTAAGSLLIGTREQGVLWSADRGKAFIPMTTGQLSRSVSCIEVQGSAVAAGCETGEIMSADLGHPFLGLSTSSLDLGFVKGRATGAVLVRNLGLELMTTRFAGVPSYASLVPASVQGNSQNVVITVDTTGLEAREYQANVRVISTGGTATLAMRFTVFVATARVLVIAEGDRTAQRDGTAYDLGVAPYIDQRTGVMLVPLRAVADAFGLSLAWDGVLRSAEVTGEDGTGTKRALVVAVGRTQATLNGVGLKLTVAPVVVDGRMLVPLRALSQTFGWTVAWNPVSRTASVRYGS